MEEMITLADDNIVYQISNWARRNPLFILYT